MKTRILHIFRNWPLFLLLLPLFFMLHSLAANFAPGMAGIALQQTLLFTGIAIVLVLLFFPAVKKINKAALISFFILSFNFFFGTIHDSVKKLFGPQSLLVRYSFIIPFFLLLLICLVILLRKSKREFKRAVLFLNVLFLLLIALELTVFFPELFRKNRNIPTALSKKFTRCDTCGKPDVYVIIADEYAGRQELNDIFSFDNTAFENELKLREFYIVNNTKSNYNATVYSMASLFNMGYIELSGKGRVTQRDMLLCRSIINNNNIGIFFKRQGYDLFNHSFFSFQEKNKAVNNYYFHPKSRILTFETFINRFLKDVGYNFFSKKKKEAVEKNDWRNDEITDSLTRITSAQKSENPRFIYTHFTRPHHPYFVDRNGLPFTHGDSLKGFERIKKEYTEYLLYTNKQLLSLIDFIIARSSRPPVILLLSDHGFRQFPADYKNQQPYWFMNFSAVYLPGRNYSGFYKGITPVNIFRQVLNAEFGQQLPLLKDSTSFIVEK